MISDLTFEQSFLFPDIPYMTAAGNQEFPFNFTSYEQRFPMPFNASGHAFASSRASSDSNAGSNPPFWYSYDVGYVHFTVISTEHKMTPVSSPSRHALVHSRLFCSETAEYFSCNHYCKYVAQLYHSC